MTSPNDLFSPLNEEEFQALEEFLLSLDDDDAILCMSELDGFFTAIISGPIAIPPLQWLEVIWGNQENSPVCDTDEEIQNTFELLVRHMNSTAVTLMKAPMDFQPCFIERIAEGNRHYTVVDDWCEGYMKGVALCPDRWNEMPRAQEDYLAPTLMFTWPRFESVRLSRAA